MSTGLLKKPGRRRKPGSGRNKGKAYERKIANDLRPTFDGAKRGIGQARSASEVADVTGVPFFWIECKRYQSPVAIKQAIKQARDAASGDGSGKLPVVISKEDHEDDLATMVYSDWLLLIEDYVRLKKSAGEIE